MTYELIPQVGYGPIKFGMNPDDVQGVLGKPKKVQESRIFDETDEEEIFYKTGRYAAWYGKRHCHVN